MLTLEALKEYGADTEDGLKRCMDNRDFYIRLIGKALENKCFTELEDYIAAGDLDGAFETAHSLKGVVGNLALTPIYKPVCEMTELLRARTEADYTPLLNEISAKREELLSLM